MENKKTQYEMVREFHECMSQPMDTFNCKENLQLLMFRVALIKEEYFEMFQALEWMYGTIVKGNNNEAYNQAKQAVLKELQDLKYVLEGLCVTYGWQSDEAFERVHKSNMSKLVDGKPYKNEDGKVEKGPNYQPPDLSDLVNSEAEDKWRDENIKVIEEPPAPQIIDVNGKPVSSGEDSENVGRDIGTDESNRENQLPDGPETPSDNGGENNASV